MVVQAAGEDADLVGDLADRGGGDALAREQAGGDGQDLVVPVRQALGSCASKPCSLAGNRSSPGGAPDTAGWQLQKAVAAAEYSEPPTWSQTSACYATSQRTAPGGEAAERQKLMTAAEVVAGAALRNDHRHRRLGLAAQADVPGPGDPAVRPDRSDVVCYGGPDVGLLCAAGKVRKLVYGFVSLDSIPLEPHFRAARQAGALEVAEYDEGMLQWGLYAAALPAAVPADPGRPRLRRHAGQPRPADRQVAYATARNSWRCPALRLDAALVHLNRADAAGNAQFLGPDPYFDDLFCMAAERAYVSCERVVPTRS